MTGTWFPDQEKSLLKVLMYKKYFGLEELPFSIAPDPRYLYMSEQHREALAHLVYGFSSNGGFVLLTGEVGTGKTTVCRCLLEQIPENAVIAFIINPKLTVEELLATICDEFGIKYPEGGRSIKYYVDLINNYLFDAHAQGKKAILIIDEAQNLSADVLEQLRLLTNLETHQVKLLQIILLGQPELRDKLSRPELRQLAQRIIARYHLGPLSKRDVAHYVTHRLAVAGLKREIFTRSAIDKLYRLSRGVPRLINVLCDRALMGAFAHDKNQVTRAILTKASREVFGESGILLKLKKIPVWSLFFLIVIIMGAVFAATYYHTKPLTEANKILDPRIIEPIRETPQSLALPGIQEKEVPESISVTMNSRKEEGAEALLRPVSLTLEQSKIIAFQSLFKAWNLMYNPQEYNSACDYAQARGLQCYYAREKLRNLVILNHPAVLNLSDRQGQEFYVALIGIQGGVATIMIGEESKKIPLKDIESSWLGDGVLLWQPHPQYQGEIKPGEQNALVPWIDEQLALIQDRQYQIRSNLFYDDKLVEQVKKFQIESGLFPDGIIGPQTLICLNAARGSDAPLLMKKEKSKRD
jgi:general secretion pathway protein A